jgi:hypothetical protein
MLFVITAFSAFAQEVAYRRMNDQTRHLISLNFGADHSMNAGVSYGYVLKNRFTPVIIGTELTVPSGRSALLDDWKWRTALQAELWKNNHFSFALKPGFIIRRNESAVAKMCNIGADLTLTFGYVRPKWGIAALVNYDHSFATHVRFGVMKTYYPGIRDGWYGSGGGNFKFGIRAHYSVKSVNLFLTAGKQLGQNFKDNPVLPFFGQLTLQWQIR